MAVNPNISVSIKSKNSERKIIEKTRIDNDIVNRFVIHDYGVIQVVYQQEDGRLLHIHCKNKGCGNEWKIPPKSDWSKFFEITKDKDDSIIKCLNCKAEHKIDLSKIRLYRFC